MGLPPDEHLPEVVPQIPTSYPEVVPDLSPGALQQRFYIESDKYKYPVYYDDAPKQFYEEPPPPTHLPGQQYYRPWTGAENLAAVSALSPGESVPWQSFSPGSGGGDDETYVGSEPEPETRICGLRKRIWITIAVVAVIVVGSAVGGGVGGSMAARQSSGSEASSSSASSSSSTTTTPSPTMTSSTSSTSSAPSPTISFLNNQTDSSQKFAFQGFENHNYTGKATSIYTTEGFFDFAFNITSYVWKPLSSECCVTFCQGKQDSSNWRCTEWYRTAASAPFRRLSIWCGKTDENIAQMNHTCS